MLNSTCLQNNAFSRMNFPDSEEEKARSRCVLMDSHLSRAPFSPPGTANNHCHLSFSSECGTADGKVALCKLTSKAKEQNSYRSCSLTVGSSYPLKDSVLKANFTEPFEPCR